MPSSVAELIKKIDDLFDFIGIDKSTTDFKVVKKAFIKKAFKHHPDKWSAASVEEQQTNAEIFKKISSAFDEIDDEEKFSDYLALKGTGVYARQNRPFESGPTFPKGAEEPTDGLRVPKQGFINVFIPVPVHDASKMHNPNVFRLNPLGSRTKEEFDKQFDFENLANVLTHFFKDARRQVGVTYDEAAEVMKQHSHRDYIVIVEVSISLNRISDNKISEQDANPSRLGAGDVDYLWLLENSDFTAEDIVSAKPMDTYSHIRTMRIPSSYTPPQQLWPHKMVDGRPVYEELTNPKTRFLEPAKQEIAGSRTKPLALEGVKPGLAGASRQGFFSSQGNGAAQVVREEISSAAQRLIEISNQLHTQINTARASFNNDKSEKGKQKKAVLEGALAIINEKTVEGRQEKLNALYSLIKDNPRYNEAIFSSTTEKLVYQAVEFSGLSVGKEKPDDEQEKIRVSQTSNQKSTLLVDLQTHLNSMKGKNDEKHNQKRAVLEAAIGVVNGTLSLGALGTIIKANPEYDAAFCSSITKTLVDQTIKICANERESVLHKDHVGFKLS